MFFGVQYFTSAYKTGQVLETSKVNISIAVLNKDNKTTFVAWGQPTYTTH